MAVNIYWQAWDNRIGTAVSLRVLENLSKEAHPNVLFAGSDVQEEVGLRGARTSTHLVNPDIAFCFRYWYSRRHSRNDTKRSRFDFRKRPTDFDFDASMIPHKNY